MRRSGTTCSSRRTPSSRSYFKVKAEIEPTADATHDNLCRYAGLIAVNARRNGIEVSHDGIARLLGMASRWAEHRERLTARFELITDVLIEASKLYPGVPLTRNTFAPRCAAARAQRSGRGSRAAGDRRRHDADPDQRRGGGTDQRTDRAVAREITRSGRRRGSRRVRRWAAAGVISIERLVAMSGPIQQKGSMTLQGLLMRCFAHQVPAVVRLQRYVRADVRRNRRRQRVDGGVHRHRFRTGRRSDPPGSGDHRLGQPAGRGAGDRWRCTTRSRASSQRASRWVR